MDGLEVPLFLETPTSITRQINPSIAFLLTKLHFDLQLEYISPVVPKGKKDIAKLDFFVRSLQDEAFACALEAQNAVGRGALHTDSTTTTTTSMRKKTS